jgi:GAF domain-containing protein
LERRSIDLETAIRQNAIRASEFEIISQITRASTSIADTENLLPRTAELISQRFGVYHTGIFILDDSQEYAVLMAVNKDGRRNLLESGYKLKVDPYGNLAAAAAATGIPRILVDIEEDPGEFDRQDFPDSRSEMAIPIKTGERTIGVIDLHSEIRNNFPESYFEVFSILADQLAVAIQNSRLYRDSQTALSESQAIYSTVVQRAWQSNILSHSQIGYRFTGTNSQKLVAPIKSPQALAALDRGEVVLTSTNKPESASTLAVPLKLRGETIGVIQVELPAEFEAGDDEIDIIEATASRISVALENSALLEESQRRAAKERAIGEISAKIGSLINVENILETAIQELGTTLPNTEIAIQFVSGEDRLEA